MKTHSKFGCLMLIIMFLVTACGSDNTKKKHKGKVSSDTSATQGEPNTGCD